jgi:putative ABC transport system permease protein
LLFREAQLILHQSYLMIQNYLKIAWRVLLKHKSFSFINILGLSIGLATCQIIFLYVHNELTYDQYNVKSDRIVRVVSTLHAPESDVVLATTPAPLADVLKRDYPEVESTVRLENISQTVKMNNEVFREDAFFKADQSIFYIFSFDFLEGSPKDALQNPRSIVLTETIEKKYFGASPAIGKTMICNGQDLLVTGVVRDRPENSDTHIDALLSAEFSKMTAWMDDFSRFTFILFRQRPDLKKFEGKLSSLSQQYVQPALDATGDTKYKLDFHLEPLSAVHFSQGKLLEDAPKGNMQFIYVFSSLAIFILIIALLNYINLSTARSMERAKEVGIRKVSGGMRVQLMCQFLFESILLLVISCLLSFVLAEIGLPFINKLLQTHLAFHWADGLPFMGALFLVTVLLAGFYPALVLSGFRPVQVLKGNWRYSGKGAFLRKTLTIVQFAIATALIMGTTVIYFQMKFIGQKSLGFNKDQLMNIYLPQDSAYMSSVHDFQDALRRRPEIQGFTVGDGMTEGGGAMSSTITKEAGKKRELMSIFYSIDAHFLSVFQIHLAEGRNLSDSLITDKKEGFLVNEAFVKMMGWRSGIGKSIEGFDHKGKIVGVVKDFHFKSLHNLVDPLVLVYNTSRANTATVKIKPGDLPIVKELFKQYFPVWPFDYSFFDEMISKQYEKDRITMSLFNDFTLLAIFVCCLGLYGLVALISVQRTKEIGIRKILGASLSQLLSLMTKDFIRLAFWALVIALPIAGIIMNIWLSSYAYHIPLSWWMFLIPVSLILFITLAVISRDIIRTASANPVTNLRIE